MTGTPDWSGCTGRVIQSVIVPAPASPLHPNTPTQRFPIRSTCDTFQVSCKDPQTESVSQSPEEMVGRHAREGSPGHAGLHGGILDYELQYEMAKSHRPEWTTRPDERPSRADDSLRWRRGDYDRSAKMCTRYADLMYDLSE